MIKYCDIEESINYIKFLDRAIEKVNNPSHIELSIDNISTNYTTTLRCTTEVTRSMFKEAMYDFLVEQRNKVKEELTKIGIDID